MTTSPDISRFLGVEPDESPGERISRLRDGLSYDAIESLREDLDLSLTELAGALGISVRTLNRRKDQGALSPEESDRVFRIARVYSHALEVFESRQRATTWFKRSNPVLDGMTPLEVFDTDFGAQLVDDLLTRVEYGVYS